MLEAEVDGIPVLAVGPEGAGAGTLVLWMSHLGGSAHQTRPMLERFASAGCTAVSFDAVGHGRRGTQDPWELATQVLGAFRRRMWPLLGQTTLDAMRVLTWAYERCQISGPARVGGLSMGGDVAVALAGIDPRVGRVATVGSTPDWSRPGMRELGDATTLVDQGEPDPGGRWLAGHLDPMSHLERYAAGVPIAFELGGADLHVPADNARAFVAALRDGGGSSALQYRIQTYPGLDHRGVTTSEAALRAAADWLLAPDPDRQEPPPGSTGGDS